MILEVLRLYPTRTVGLSIAFGTMFFFAQVAYLVFNVADRYESSESSTGKDLIWFVYKELPAALPMAAVFAVGAVVVAQAAARFIRSGPTVGELPNWIRNHPAGAAFNIAIVALLAVGAILSNASLVGFALGAMITQFFAPWASWVADIVEKPSRSTDESGVGKG